MQKLLQIRFRVLAIGWLMMMLAAQHAIAQTASEYEVKAAYLYNFAKFIEWPTQEAGDPAAIRLCVFNNASFASQLEQIVKGKNIRGGSISVAVVHDANESRNCSVLFIDATQDRLSREVIQVLRGTSVVTVGDGRDFLEKGGTIRFTMEGDRVQFEVNMKSATSANLRVSSRLLSVARNVIK